MSVWTPVVYPIKRWNHGSWGRWFLYVFMIFQPLSGPGKSQHLLFLKHQSFNKLLNLPTWILQSGQFFLPPPPKKITPKNRPGRPEMWHPNGGFSSSHSSLLWHPDSRSLTVMLSSLRSQISSSRSEIRRYRGLTDWNRWDPAVSN